ncbi:solute carrier family 66 member 3 isoform X1 [Panthera onca]
MTVYASHLLLLLDGEHSGRPQGSSRWLLPRSGPASLGPEAPSLLVLACRSDLSETHLCHHLRQRPRAPRPAPSQSRMLEKLRAVLSYGPALCVRNLPPPPDVSSFLVFLRYQCYYEYPLLTYLEYPILIAQDVLLLLCAFHFNGNVKGAAPYMAVYPFRCPGIRWDWGVRCFGQSRVLVVKLKKIPNAQSKYFHQRGQQVCSAPVPVEDQGLGHRELPHLEPRCIHLCNKNNNNDNDHRRSYDSYTFRDHACFKRVGNHHGPSLQEDGGKG